MTIFIAHGSGDTILAADRPGRIARMTVCGLVAKAKAMTVRWPYAPILRRNMRISDVSDTVRPGEYGTRPWTRKDLERKGLFKLFYDVCGEWQSVVPTGGMVMVKVSRLNGKAFYVNPDLIEFIEATPDTVITLTTGKKVVVEASVERVVEEIVAYKQRIFLGLPQVIREERQG